MKKKNGSKKMFVSTVSTALVVSALAPIIPVSKVSATEIGFDTSKVNVANFIVTDVTGGVSISLTSAAKILTGEIHVPAQLNGKNVVAVDYEGFEYSKASAIYFEDSSLIAEIGAYAFSDTQATNPISLMNIKEVPAWAFQNSSFSEIHIDSDKVTRIGRVAFDAAKATNPIYLMNITSIPDFAFDSALFSEIHVDPNKVTSLGRSAFFDVKATHPMSLPNITSVSEFAFYGSSFSEIHINPNKITSIGESAFEGTIATNSISLPNITSIPKWAFYDSSFREIHVNPNKVTSIGQLAFFYSAATNEISLPNITTVPPSAFYGSGFSKIQLDGSKITSIGEFSFAFSQATNEISLPNITTVPYSAFNESKFSAIYLDSDKVTSIEDYSFADARAKNILSLLNITAVPYYAFGGSKFSEIRLDSNKVTSISPFAFAGTIAENDISLPNITEVSSHAFYGSTFNQITLDSEKVTSVGTNAFNFPPNIVLDSTTNADKSSATVKVTPQSQVNIAEIKFAKGTPTADFFNFNGTTVTNNQFDVSENGTYTVFVRDGANRTVIKTVTINDIVSNNGDTEGPIISFSENGSTRVSKDRYTIVTVTDKNEVAYQEYQWSTSATPLTDGVWETFESGASIATPSNVTGDYYLHVKAEDVVGNASYSISNAFKLDNEAPLVPILIADKTEVTRENVMVSIEYPGDDVASKQYRTNNGTWKNYDAPIEINDNGIVEARSIDEAGNESEIGLLTVSNIDKSTEPLLPVQNITAESINKQAKVTWDSLEGATRYRVQPYVLNEETGKFEVYRLALATTNQEVLFANLETGKTYKFEVTPLIVTYISGLSNFSGELLMPKEDISPIDPNNLPVKNVVAAKNDDETITITWDSLEGATRYRVQAYVLNEATGEFDKHYLALATYDTLLTYKNIQEGNTYRFEVLPMFGTYITERAGLSNDITMSVEEIPESEKTSLEVIVDGITASFSWGAMENIERYRVQLYIQNELGQFVKEGASRAVTTTTHQVTNLKPGNTYQMVVEPRIGYIYDTKQALFITFSVE